MERSRRWVAPPGWAPTQSVPLPWTGGAVQRGGSLRNGVLSVPLGEHAERRRWVEARLNSRARARFAFLSPRRWLGMLRGRHGDTGGNSGGGGSSGVPPRLVSGGGGLVAGIPSPDEVSSSTSRHGNERTRILMLISDTGGGHRASAQALESAFEELFPGAVETCIVDFWTEIAGRPFDKFPQGYSFLAKNPSLWRCAWNYGRFPLTRRLTEEFSNVVGNRNFRNAIQDFDPHLIVSVHPLTQFIPLRVLRTLPKKIPFVTVCTDLGGAHPTWFHPDVDMCFVPTDRVRRIAQRCGLADSQLRQYGLPVRPAFWREGRDKQSVKGELGLVQHLPTVLIVGGGDGVGGVGRIARAIADRLDTSGDAPGGQIVVVCGKNERLRKQLASASWPVPVHVNGFVSNMSEWMAASDMIVSKAGPGTIAEALIRGLPIVLSGFLPGQEAPNVKYVTESGVGAFSRDPDTIAGLVQHWLSHPKALSERASRAKSLGRPNSTYEIVREISSLDPHLAQLASHASGRIPPWLEPGSNGDADAGQA